MMGKEVEMTNLNKIFEELKDMNPYPKDIFLERSSQDWKMFHNILEKANLKGDGFLGHANRLCWINAIDKCKIELEQQIKARIKELEEKLKSKVWLTAGSIDTIEGRIAENKRWLGEEK